MSHQDPEWRESQYALLRPPFKLRDEFIPRDRYRAVKTGAEAWDIESMGGEGLDEFDEELLQQPYEDRKSQAAKGHARLSLRPRDGRIQNAQTPYGLEMRRDATQGLDDKFSHFTYQRIEGPESSSEVQYGTSSSPAFKAGLRRVEHNAQRMKTPIGSERRLSGPIEVNNRSFDHMDIPFQLYTWEEATTCHPQAPEKTSCTRPIVQGIQLVSITALPDRLRTVFPYSTFNAVQSKCFNNMFKSDDNFLLASPTGSGKTVVLELAICRAISTNATDQYKIVYQAPIKALCSERQRDWAAKFGPLGLKCIELTGDTETMELANIQSANLIITTPEKWDSLTRKWKDHERLMRLIKLFLIDEVHILKEDRGATLEAIVSRMKSIGTTVRFVALSATVPNSHDVAAWLGKSSTEPYEPAISEKFGEEFRPVKLKKQVYGYSGNPNDFVFDTFLNTHLKDIITKHSERKPIMIFCFTRASAATTAHFLAEWWQSQKNCDRLWNAPSNLLQIRDDSLRKVVISGVAFHHAGLENNDRIAIEQAFLHGDTSIICCTSTLAVGVNLPCHLVIVKNTVCYTSNGTTQEYPDLETMQMIGRAGRPQFDNTAVAVIMTRQTKVHRYEKMVSGQEHLESKLHLNLINHMNAEIGLGTIFDRTSARRWLMGTFLYVRLKQNPSYYKLECTTSDQSVDDQIEDICSRDIELLQNTGLVGQNENLRCTEFGHAMARYYIQFETMRLFMGLKPKASISEILSAIAQASEFESIRLRMGEKTFYKSLNRSSSIRFPIQVNIALSSHKVTLIIQATLGGADLTSAADGQSQLTQFKTDLALVFKHIHRLIRCVADCQIKRGDSISTSHALMLGRSLGAGVWDDSPLIMKQIESIGVMGVRRLVAANIRSIEELECSEAHRIESALARNPPFGMKILNTLQSFPKLRISLQVQSSSATKTRDGVKIQVKADIGLLNERPPRTFSKKLVYVCLLVECSDGRIIHFARISGDKLGQGQTLCFPATIKRPNQHINAYVMCDQIAGTMRGATVKPIIHQSMFPIPTIDGSNSIYQQVHRPLSNTSIRRSSDSENGKKTMMAGDEFGDDELDDEDFMQANSYDPQFDLIENYPDPLDSLTRQNTTRNSGRASEADIKSGTVESQQLAEEPRRLENGRWECKHKCGDKTACKHFCCRDGVEKPHKKPAAKRVSTDETAPLTDSKSKSTSGKTQTKLKLSAKRRSSGPIEELDLTHVDKMRKLNGSQRKDYDELNRLHQKIQQKNLPSSISSIMNTKPGYHYGQGGKYSLSFLEEDCSLNLHGNDRGDDEDVHPESSESTHANVVSSKASKTKSRIDVDCFTDHIDAFSTVPQFSDSFGDDDSTFNDAIIGIADSQELQNSQIDLFDDDLQAFEAAPSTDEKHDSPAEGVVQTNLIFKDKKGTADNEALHTLSTEHVSFCKPEKDRSLFVNDTSSPQSKDSFGLLDLAIPCAEKPQNPRIKKLDGNDALHEVRKERASKTELEMPEAYQGLEPWLFKEFGDVIELVDRIE
ncbi:P-loop containing nucleoside triphosphate hydrolase protein [Corynespora cassiicola Philippines]|uniref:DNA 3'-5' helicase n=1 Tax=Corynespora cassiicola Philippines TaxID=1448308 RepID=A0A2T2P769_CORCC|nr:P-loop containing nucleoside triphosphate hydrolase protein [Corynespora cassiicola Philippines]